MLIMARTSFPILGKHLWMSQGESESLIWAATLSNTDKVAADEKKLAHGWGKMCQRLKLMSVRNLSIKKMISKYQLLQALKHEQQKKITTI